jgi:hypothetical protein
MPVSKSKVENGTSGSIHLAGCGRWWRIRRGQDRDGAETLLETIRGQVPRFKCIWADVGYVGQWGTGSKVLADGFWIV